MKYKKGTFVVVPNIDVLDNKPPELQTLFMWICVYSDDDGICYPSRKTLANKCGVSIKTIDKYMKELESLDLLQKTLRKKENSKENKSNLYQICVPDTLGNDSGLPQVVESMPHPSEPDDIGTISNITISNVTIDTPIEVKKILPIERGNNPHQRVDSIYRDLFKDKYGVYPNNATIGMRLKVLKELCNSYTELQLAFLLIVFFAWKGMTDSDDKAQNYLQSKAHDLFTFKYNLNQYEIYTRNVAGYSKEFDDSDLLLPIVGKYVTELLRGK